LSEREFRDTLNPVNVIDSDFKRYVK